MSDYSLIDRPQLLQYVFCPRKDSTSCPANAFDLFVPVEEGISIHCRFHAGLSQGPWILFFHGNGEVVSDYDGIAPLYHRRGLNLVIAEYRGYGDSDGTPTLTDLLQDAHLLFKAVKEELSSRWPGSLLWVMGRSLGSLSALELASHHPADMTGLIIESGFTSIVRMIRRLEIPAQGADLEEMDRECVHRVHQIVVPALIIHGQEDSLVPLEEAEDLYRYLGSREKELLVIPSAGHNDILYVGFQAYFETLKRFIENTSREK